MPYLADTYLAKVNPMKPNPQSMALAGQVIADGGLVAFPTETVYGLGANALDEEAVSRIFEAKQRPANDPLIIHIERMEQLNRVARDIPDAAYRLADRFWAGALTLVLPKHADVPMNVTAGQDTVAVRMPAHPVAQALIRQSGTPIAAPSANRFSRPSPTSALHVLQDLNGHVDVIIDGGQTAIGLESTIVDLTQSPPMVLRPGGIALEALRDVLPDVQYTPRDVAEDVPASSPGTLLKHYSPDAEVVVYSGEDERVFQSMRAAADRYHEEGKRVGLLALDREAFHLRDITDHLVTLGESIEEMAHNLFAGMRELDAAEVDVMLIHAPEQVGIGVALYDRLRRASEGHIITPDDN